MAGHKTNKNKTTEETPSTTPYLELSGGVKVLASPYHAGEHPTRKLSALEEEYMHELSALEEEHTCKSSALEEEYTCKLSALQKKYTHKSPTPEEEPEPTVVVSPALPYKAKNKRKPWKATMQRTQVKAQKRVPWWLWTTSIAVTMIEVLLGFWWWSTVS